jgi:hypothetical protein
MILKDPVWMLIIVAGLAVLSINGFIQVEFVIISFVTFLLFVGLTIEIDEISAGNRIRGLIAPRIQRIEESIAKAVQKIESEERIRQRVAAKRKEVIEWLCKF